MSAPYIDYFMMKNKLSLTHIHTIPNSSMRTLLPSCIRLISPFTPINWCVVAWKDPDNQDLINELLIWRTSCTSKWPKTAMTEIEQTSKWPKPKGKNKWITLKFLDPRPVEASISIGFSDPVPAIDAKNRSAIRDLPVPGGPTMHCTFDPACHRRTNSSRGLLESIYLVRKRTSKFGPK